MYSGLHKGARHPFHTRAAQSIGMAAIESEALGTVEGLQIFCRPLTRPPEGCLGARRWSGTRNKCELLKIETHLESHFGQAIVGVGVNGVISYFLPYHKNQHTPSCQHRIFNFSGTMCIQSSGLDCTTVGTLSSSTVGSGPSSTRNLYCVTCISNQWRCLHFTAGEHSVLFIENADRHTQPQRFRTNYRGSTNKAQYVCALSEYFLE